MENSKGLVTIPTDLDVVPETLELMKRWGADAIRDCDGTDFPVVRSTTSHQRLMSSRVFGLSMSG